MFYNQKSAGKLKINSFMILLPKLEFFIFLVAIKQ